MRWDECAYAFVDAIAVTTGSGKQLQTEHQAVRSVPVAANQEHHRTSGPDMTAYEHWKGGRHVDVDADASSAQNPPEEKEQEATSAEEYSYEQAG